MKEATKKTSCRGLNFAFVGLFLGSFSLGKFLVELVDTAVDGSASLFASVEWVAVCAGFDLKLGSKGGSGGEGGSAADAGDLALVVLWVDVFLHFLYSFRLGTYFCQREFASNHTRGNLLSQVKSTANCKDRF